MTEQNPMLKSTDYRISEESWYQQNVFKWALYDLGNTIFSMVVVSLTIVPLVYILYYNRLNDGSQAVNDGNTAIAITFFIGNILMAFISPFLGAYSDHQEERRPLLLKITMLCLVFMASLIASAYTGSVIVILAIFLFANIFYQMGLIVYDAMLPFITDKDSVGKVAGYGVALGYFGSFIGIGIGFLLIPFYGDFFADPEYEFKNGSIGPRFEIGYIPYIFPLAALMFLLFALPMFTVKEKPRTLPPVTAEKLYQNVTNQVKETGREIYNYRSMKLFLIGWLIYVDAANTIIAFMTPIIQIGLNFGKGSTVLVVLAIGIASAVAFTYPVGLYVDKNGPKKGLKLVTLLWLLSLSIGLITNLETEFLSTPKWPVFIFPVILGPGLGGTWVVQRAYVTQLAPPEKVGNYFGFTNIFGRISAAIGPFVWAISVRTLDIGLGYSTEISTRLAILVIMALMLIGYTIISFGVKDVHEVYLSGGKATGNDTWVDDDGNLMYP